MKNLLTPMQKNVLFALCCSLSTISYAEPKLPTPINDRIEPSIPSIEEPTSTPKTLDIQQQTNNTIAISKEELAKHPDLIIRGLIPALTQNNSTVVELLLPLYQQQAKTDALLLQWGRAILAVSQQQYTQGVQLYRTIISQQPDLLPVRLQLARALFLNHDNEASADQFEKLRAEQTLPAALYTMIDQYLTALQQRQRWSFSGGINYVRDNNINNAPKTNTSVGDWKAWESESAQGLQYDLGASKKWAINNGYFMRLDTSVNGKYYWDNQKYNELNTRLGAGIGYQNAQVERSIVPFISKRWYGGGASGNDKLKSYSQSYGVQLNQRYWISNQWQLTNTFEYSEQRHKTRQHLDGNSYFIDNTIVYLPDSAQYWFAGIHYYRSNARDKDDAFNRYGAQIGWGQEWHNGLSSRLSLNYAYRQYLAPGRMLNKKQVNHEYTPQLTVWHRNIHFWGITPRITWAYNKVNSNHSFYTYDKHNVYLDISKRF